MATVPFGMYVGVGGVKDPWLQGGGDCAYPSVAITPGAEWLVPAALVFSPLAAPTPVPHRCAPTPASAVPLGVPAIPFPASFSVPFPVPISVPPVPLSFSLSLPVPLPTVLPTFLSLQLSVPFTLGFLLPLLLLFFFLLLSPLLPFLGPFGPLCLLLNDLAVSQWEPIDAGSCLGLSEKVIQQLGRWFLLGFLFLLTLLFFRLCAFLAAAVTGP